MKLRNAATIIALGLSLAGFAGAADAAVRYFDFTVYDPASHLAGAGGPAGGNFGTVKVEDFGSNYLEFTVDLAAGYGFQNVGNNKTHDALAFDIIGDPKAVFTFLSPTSGVFDGNDTFTGAGAKADSYGAQGWSPAYDYAVQVHNKNHDNYLFGDLNSEILKFRLATTCTGACVPPALTVNSLGSEVGGGHTIFFSADLSGAAGGFATGPVGAIEHFQTSPGVPEPESWTLMILGFGGVGALLRRSRRIAARGAPAA